MAESKLREMSTDFAVNIIKLCETIRGHYSLVNQLKLFVKYEILNKDMVADLYNQCGTIRRMLIASIHTAKGKQKHDIAYSRSILSPGVCFYRITIQCRSFPLSLLRSPVPVLYRGWECPEWWIPRIPFHRGEYCLNQ